MMLKRQPVAVGLAAVFFEVSVRPVGLGMVRMALSTNVSSAVVLGPVTVATLVSVFSACCVPHAAAIPAAKRQRSATNVVNSRIL
jgi:hypothetical protein